jgi:hypothetical protein
MTFPAPHDQTPACVGHGPYNCLYCRQEAYAFVAANPREPGESGTQPGDLYIVVPASPWGTLPALLGPMSESEALSRLDKWLPVLMEGCPPKLVRVVKDYAANPEPQPADQPERQTS